VSVRPSIVSQYWAGVLQRLEAEVDVFSELIRHEGERGRENEAALGRILSSFVPRRYGVGSGLLIDAHDSYSRQTDLVVFDQSDEPSALAQTTQLLFPVESVLASIEVKTTLRKEDVEDCTAKQLSMLALEPSQPHPDGSTHPYFVILAYHAGISPQKIVEHFREAEVRPDLLCVLEPALISGTAPLLRHEEEVEMAAGIALLASEKGDPIRAQPTGPEMMGIHGGRTYPIVRHQGASYLAERPRALLLFVEALVALLAAKQARRPPALSAYIPAAMRSLATFD
jgi:hypothetical protein